MLVKCHICINAPSLATCAETYLNSIIKLEAIKLQSFRLNIIDSVVARCREKNTFPSLSFTSRSIGITCKNTSTDVTTLILQKINYQIHIDDTTKHAKRRYAQTIKLLYTPHAQEGYSFNLHCVPILWRKTKCKRIQCCLTNWL